MGARGPRCTFQQIAGKLREQVAATEPTHPGPAKLGSEAELSARFGASRNTLRKALSQLAGEGLIHSVPTRGWYVGQPSERSAPGPLEIAAELAAKIQERGLGPGVRLTTVPGLAARFGVSAYTARCALLALEAQGLVESRHGKGWYVMTVVKPEVSGGV